MHWSSKTETRNHRQRNIFNEQKNQRSKIFSKKRTNLIQLKNFLRDSSPEHHVFIAELYYTNNNITKITAKTRLFNKFNWLVYRYYLSCWRDGEYHDQNFSYVYLYRQAKRQVSQPATIATFTNTTKPTRQIRVEQFDTVLS